MFDKFKQKLNVRRGRQIKSQGRKGQSLVETTLILPILVLLFIGVIEVGWAVRGYLVLVNVNREAVRYAVKNQVLTYADKDPATVGYDKVLSHTLDSLTDQLPLDFDLNPNTTVIMSHFVIDTGLPCANIKADGTYEFDSNCDCTEDDPYASQWFTKDDLIAHPGDPAYPHYLQMYGLNETTRLGRGDYQALADQLTLENNQVNCTIMKTGTAGELSVNNLFIAEAFYEQPQLLKIPLISNRLTDPIPFYTHTAMRLVSSRNDSMDTVGPVCEVYPITFDDGIFPDPDHPVSGQEIDAFEGHDPGNFGWLTWDPAPGRNNANYAVEELQNPRLSMHDFTDTDDPSDHSLRIGSHVSSGPGVSNSSAAQKQLEAMVGSTIRVPVYHTSSGTGQNVSYTVSHFALVTISEICLPAFHCPSGGSDKRIQATFVGYDDEACSGGSPGGGGGGGGGGNNPPVAVDDNATTDKDIPIVIDLLGNDSDPDGDTLTVESMTDPAKGLVLDNGDGTVTYTPKNNASGVGTFTFTYTISDGNGGTDTATVTITVTAGGNSPPVAANDNATTNQDTAVTIDVVSNDSDPDGDPITVDSVGTASNGNVVNNGDGTVTYTPNAGFSGSDSFTYTISDGNEGTDTATVTITVTTGGNSPPVAANDSATTNQDTAVTIDVVGNDSDPDGDTLTVDAVGTASHGNVVNNGDGTVTYTPNAGFSGSDNFTYTIGDGNGGTSTATVTVTVNSTNNPPVAVDDTATTNQGAAVAIDVGSNDSDPDGDPLVYSDFSNPANGSVVYNGAGVVTYTPNAGFSGTDSFTYQVNDGNGGTATATVTVTVNQPATLHISSIVVQANVNWWWGRSYYQGVADVTVVDGNGVKIEGATVQGDWTGPQPGSDSGTTDSNGVATLSTDQKRNKSGTYTFCVTSITKAGYTYDSNANLETCDSDSS